MSRIVKLEKALREEGKETRIRVARALPGLEDPRTIARLYQFGR